MYADKSMDGISEALDSFRYIPGTLRKKILELAHTANQEAYQRGVADGKMVKERPADWDITKILAQRSLTRGDIVLLAHQIGTAEGFWQVLRQKGIELTMDEATALFNSAQQSEND